MLCVTPEIAIQPVAHVNELFRHHDFQRFRLRAVYPR